MKLHSKKEVKGKPVAIYNTEGHSAQDIVKQMASDGWIFDKLVFKYVSKDGQTKSMEIPVAKMAAVQKKYHFKDWIFKTHRGNQSLSGKISDEKGFLFITSSKNKAIQYVTSMFSSEQEVSDLSGKTSNGKISDPIEPIVPQQDDAAKAAADSLFETEDPSNISFAITPEQRQARRINERISDNERFADVSENKHMLLRILAILTLPSAGIGFGFFSLSSTLRGCENASTAPEESIRNFRDARILLGLAIPAALLSWGVAAYKLSPIFLG